MIVDDITQLAEGLRETMTKAAEESDLLETPAGCKVYADAIQGLKALEDMAIELAEAIEGGG